MNTLKIGDCVKVVDLTGCRDPNMMVALKECARLRVTGVRGDFVDAQREDNGVCLGGMFYYRYAKIEERKVSKPVRQPFNSTRTCEMTERTIRAGDTLIWTGEDGPVLLTDQKIAVKEVSGASVRFRAPDGHMHTWHMNYLLDQTEHSEKPTERGDQVNKADAGKSDPLLVEQDLAKALLLVNRVLDYGAEKYARAGWKTVDPARYDAAGRRHKRSRDLGEVCDAESGLLHLAHEATNILFLLDMEIERALKDDDVSLDMLGKYNLPPQGHKE